MEKLNPSPEGQSKKFWRRLQVSLYMRSMVVAQFRSVLTLVCVHSYRKKEIRMFYCITTGNAKSERSHRIFGSIRRGRGPEKVPGLAISPLHTGYALASKPIGCNRMQHALFVICLDHARLDALVKRTDRYGRYLCAMPLPRSPDPEDEAGTIS